MADFMVSFKDLCGNNSKSLKISPGESHTITICQKKISTFEFDSGFFSDNGTFLLPEGLDAEKGRASIGSLFSSVFKLADESPELKFLVTGHEETESSDTLSFYRAQIVYALFTGDKELFSETANAPFKTSMRI